MTCLSVLVLLLAIPTPPAKADEDAQQHAYEKLKSGEPLNDQDVNDLAARPENAQPSSAPFPSSALICPGMVVLIIVVAVSMARSPEKKRKALPTQSTWHGNPESSGGGGHEPETVKPRSLTKQLGRGRFQIDGVDRLSKLDTTWYCTAESIENAKAKGELEGIFVTAVRRVN